MPATALQQGVAARIRLRVSHRTPILTTVERAYEPPRDSTLNYRRVYWCSDSEAGHPCELPWRSWALRAGGRGSSPWTAPPPGVARRHGSTSQDRSPRRRVLLAGNQIVVPTPSSDAIRLLPAPGWLVRSGRPTDVPGCFSLGGGGPSWTFSIEAADRRRPPPAMQILLRCARLHGQLPNREN